MGNVAEPATKRFLTEDIYTHLTYADIDAAKDLTSFASQDAENNLWQNQKTKTLAIGDTFMTSNSMVVVEGLDKDIDKRANNIADSDLAVAAMLKVEDMNKNIYRARPLFIIHNFEVFTKDAILDALGLKFAFNKIDPSTGKIDIIVHEKKTNKKEFIIMKAIIFPGINLLWTGCVLMILGSLLAI